MRFVMRYDRTEAEVGTAMDVIKDEIFKGRIPGCGLPGYDLREKLDPRTLVFWQ